MATLFSAREIATLALRKAGIVSPQDTAASEDKLLIALKFLDTILSEKSGSGRLWFLVPQSLTFSYTADAASVDITSLLGSTRIDMFRAAYNDDTDDEITLLREADFQTIKNGGALPFTSGRNLYIASDGDGTYTAYMLPAPTAALTVRITGQTLTPAVAGATQSSSELAHGFEMSWQRWMIHALAHDVGDGPLARLPEERLNRFMGIANESWAKLNGYRSGGQRKAVRFTRAWTG